MRKFKLIKEYPGSPKLNTILTHEELQYCNWDEYYEEVVEKDYEILEYKTESGFICNAPFLPDSHGFYMNERCIINSIKRLSDGEIFTIGDLIGTPGNTYPLKEFKIIDSENTISVHCYENKTCGSGHYNHRLKNLKKAKQPLFTTEDGVDIFKNSNKYYTPIYIVDKALNIRYCEKDFNTKPSNNVKYFYSKEKAEEYILYNKPLLTLKDVEELLCKNTSSYFLEKFKKRAQKLNK